MRETKVLCLPHLHLGAPEYPPWSKILHLTIRTFLYSKKCEIKLPGCWGECSEGENGGRRGQEVVCVVLGIDILIIDVL